MEEKTSFQVFYQAFFDEMEQNRKFFRYYGVSDEEAMELATMRADNYLHEAIGRLLLSCSPEVDWYDIDEETQSFNFIATNTEISLIAKLMFEQYYEKGLGRLDVVLNTLTASDMKLLANPSQERNSFNNMLTKIKADNDTAITKYSARDRLTNRRRTIEYDE